MKDMPNQRDLGEFPVTVTMSYNAMVGALHACMYLMGNPHLRRPPDERDMRAAAEAISAVMERLDEESHRAFLAALASVSTQE